MNTFDRVVKAWKSFPGRIDLRITELAKALNVSVAEVHAINRELGGQYRDGFEINSVVTPSIITAGDKLWARVK